LTRARGRDAAAFLFVVILSLVFAPEPSGDGVTLAYTGPGAGFAFLGSFLSLLIGFFVSFASLLVWPFRMLWRMARRRKGFRDARVEKIIFLGLDGFDPNLTDRFLAEGKLPNLAKLREQGSYHRLRTTFPSLSPVAWSTFATGVSPARHNIFDFLNRSLKTYVPELASSKVHGPRRVWTVGKWRIPLSRPYVEMKRKSQTFWKILGEHFIGSTILRVPITFPPEKFNGRVLSAMSTPDLKGTQGSFAQFTTRVEQTTYEQGSRYPLKRDGVALAGVIEGPENSMRVEGEPIRIPFRLAPNGKPNAYRLAVGDEEHDLAPGEYSPWVALKFKAAPGVTVSGVARFMITETAPEFSLYMTPINIDPENPALPISHPGYYATYLAKLLGTFATVGMAEDTWALNEGVIDERAFLDQAYQIQAEREAMFLNALERTRHGVVACVFDTSDRVQHMFYRYLDGRATDEKFRGAIDDLYQRMDRLAGEAMRFVDDRTVFFVLSDHGFCSFRRGINLNTWLLENGYLALKDGARESGPYFQGVDWSRTRAYTVGLGGLYINLKGREANGLVRAAEAEALKRELAQKLTGLADAETGAVGITHAWVAGDLYKGPYLEAAPDLIIGYGEGYRTSWDAAVGRVSARVFEDNAKAWSGDHCVDPHLVPGVLFSNRKIERESPGIEDLAPTALELFGVAPPEWMEGKALL
jgi:predicted AlkP superfamily phosphohydrolase/phosphomutase